ncbi:MAG TPA: RodZ domain-containing protein [Acetobacteraceae bacterium]|nr:RodZ domain-containing protein [Acetobacteraceae bacterium]
MEYETSPETGAARLGGELRAARERLGWDLTAVAAGLRIRLPYLQALEAGRPGDLPGTAYAIGFLRTYAQALGLDPDAMARRYRTEIGEVGRKTELTFPAPVPERGVPAGALALLGLVLAIGAYVGWYRYSGSGNDAANTIPPVPARLAEHAAPAAIPSPQVATVLPPPSSEPQPQPQVPSYTPPDIPPSQAAAAMREPAPNAAASGAAVAPSAGDGSATIPPAAPAQPGGTATAPGTAVASAAALPPPRDVSPGQAAAASLPPGAADAAGNQGQILLRATADSWVQVRQKSGPVLLSRILRAGDTWTVPADKPQLLLTTGNAGGTELVVDGVATAPLGSNGAVRRDLPLSADAIRAGKLLPPGTSTAHAAPQ